MKDKQIIIDGVDVSGCEYYCADDKTCREVNGKYETDICEFDKCENPNCYYKQLKRKEQECERLDNEAQNLFTEKINLEIELTQLKAENERLKKGIFKLDKTQPQVILTEGQVSLMYCTFLDMELKTTKLKQALQEIKEIAKDESYIGFWDEQISKILQKISECEVENER